MRTSSTRKGLTYSEVVVGIILVLLLLSVSVPNISGVRIRARDTKALSNAKLIGLACKQFAIDHDGHYPGYIIINGTTSRIQISDYSNTAFDQLFPDYLTTIRLFYQPESAWTPKQLNDPDMSKISKDNPPLPAGSNEWAYVVGLSDTSSSIFPLIADGFADLKSHAYTTEETAKGGVWKGRHAIVVFCDDSAKVMKCDSSTHTVPGSPNGADLFDISGQPHWMNSAGPNGQHVLNPR